MKTRFYLSKKLSVLLFESFDHGDYSNAPSNFIGVSILGYSFLGIGYHLFSKPF